MWRCPSGELLSLVTVGAGQSNHCRMTAAAGALLGLDVHLVLSGERPERLEGNQLLGALFGAQLHFTGEPDHHWGALEIVRESVTDALIADGSDRIQFQSAARPLSVLLVMSLAIWSFPNNSWPRRLTFPLLCTPRRAEAPTQGLLPVRQCAGLSVCRRRRSSQSGWPKVW